MEKEEYTTQTAVEPVKDKQPPISSNDSHKLFEFRCFLCGDTADHRCLSCGKSVCMRCWNKVQASCTECWPKSADNPVGSFQSHIFN